jgi:hypothetical protein
MTPTPSLVGRERPVGLVSASSIIGWGPNDDHHDHDERGSGDERDADEALRDR